MFLGILPKLVLYGVPDLTWHCITSVVSCYTELMYDSFFASISNCELAKEGWRDDAIKQLEKNVVLQCSVF